MPHGIVAKDAQVGIVTFTVDSMLTDFYENRFPVFLEHDIQGTIFPHTKAVGMNEWLMDWDDMRALDAAGWEIGAHSYSHDYLLTQVDEDTLDHELGAPAALIFREIGKYPTSFASPFGDFDDKMLERVKLYYDAHLGAWGNNGVNELEATDHFRINRAEIEYQRSADDICAEMAQAGENGDWLVYMLHSIVDEEPEEYEISHYVFRKIVTCAAELRGNGKLRVMTTKEALRHVSHSEKQ